MKRHARITIAVVATAIAVASATLASPAPTLAASRHTPTHVYVTRQQLSAPRLYPYNVRLRHQRNPSNEIIVQVP